MNNVKTKTHALYGQVRFVLDCDDKYKPMAEDVLSVTGNNTNKKYSSQSLLERRDLYNLIESSSNDMDLFEYWIYHNFDTLNQAKSAQKLLFKNEAEVLNSVSLDDFAEIKIHPFSCNYMYKPDKNGLVRTSSYNAWTNAFPTEALLKFKDIDFNKPIFVWYYFKCLPKYDIENLLKPTSDRICQYLATTDKHFKHFKVDGEFVDKQEDGRIYIFICNVEDANSGPF